MARRMKQPFGPLAEPVLATNLPLQVEVIELDRIAAVAAEVSRYVAQSRPQSINHDPRWLTVLGRAVFLHQRLVYLPSVLCCAAFLEVFTRWWLAASFRAAAAR